MTTAERYHDISCGHRVYGHESKCAHLHGHNYRFFFTIVAPELDTVGRVLDFSVIKERLCVWLEAIYDHKFLVWENDPILPALQELDPVGGVYRSNFAVVRADKIACFAVNDYNIRLNNLAISRYIGGNPVALLIIICPLQTGHWS